MVNNLLLLLAAAIWGLGFVAQSFGMAQLGPFSFAGVRFLVGAFTLIPLLWYFYRQGKFKGPTKMQILFAGLPIGLFLFIAASLQQVGLQYTTASNAGFITGLYVILVPIIGVFLKHKTNLNVWVGCLIALIGMYFLCVADKFSVNFGDVLQLIGAFFWAGHLLTIDYFSKKVHPVLLSFLQFLVCGTLSLVVSFFFEKMTSDAVLGSWKPICFSGIMSVGVAYTLQVIGQKNAKPAPAAIILSLEAVFAAIGGVLYLNEVLSLRSLVGCSLMLAGIMVSQLQWKKKAKTTV